MRFSDLFVHFSLHLLYSTLRYQNPWTLATFCIGTYTLYNLFTYWYSARFCQGMCSAGGQHSRPYGTRAPCRLGNDKPSDPRKPPDHSADMDAFKLYVLDVGLLGALTMAQPDQILIGNNVFSEYKGAFTFSISGLVSLMPVTCASQLISSSKI